VVNCLIYYYFDYIINLVVDNYLFNVNNYLFVNDNYLFEVDIYLFDVDNYLDNNYI
jgi:hypothetical protein